MSDRFNRPPESIRDIQLKGKVHYLSAKERLRLSATAPPYIPSDVGPNSEFDPNNSLPFYAPRPYEETVQRASAVLFNIRSDRHGVLHHSPSDVQDLLVLAKELSTEESISTSDVDANDFAFARAAERSHVEATVPVLACDTPLDLLDTNLDNAVYAVLKSLPSIPAHENPYQELEDEGLRLQPPPIQQATTCLDLDSSTSNGTKTQARKNSRRIRTVKSHRNGFVRENEDQLYTVHPSRRLMRDLDSFKIPADIRSLVPTSPACPVLEKLVPPQVRFSSSPTPGQLARAILETEPHDLSDRILRKFRITRPVSSLRSYRRALESLGFVFVPSDHASLTQVWNALRSAPAFGAACTRYSRARATLEAVCCRASDCSLAELSEAFARAVREDFVSQAFRRSLRTDTSNHARYSRRLPSRISRIVFETEDPELIEAYQYFDQLAGKPVSASPSQVKQAHAFLKSLPAEPQNILDSAVFKSLQSFMNNPLYNILTIVVLTLLMPHLPEILQLIAGQMIAFCAGNVVGSVVGKVIHRILRPEMHTPMSTALKATLRSFFNQFCRFFATILPEKFSGFFKESMLDEIVEYRASDFANPLVGFTHQAQYYMGDKFEKFRSDHFSPSGYPRDSAFQFCARFRNYMPPKPYYEPQDPFSRAVEGYEVLTTSDHEAVYACCRIREAIGEHNGTDQKLEFRDWLTQRLTKDEFPDYQEYKGSPQNVNDLDSWTEFIKNMSSTIFGVMNPEVLARRARTFSTLWKGTIDTTAATRWLLPTIYSLGNYIAVMLTGRSWFHSNSFELSKLTSDLRVKLVNQTTRLVAGASALSLIPEYQLMCRDVERGRILAASLDSLDEAFKSWESFIKVFNDYSLNLAARDSAQRPRCLPLCIFLSGPPDIGKTQFVQALAAELHAHHRLPNSNIATIDNNRNFPDAWTTQATVIVDEWLTMNDAEKRLSDVSFVLDNVGTVPMLIEKAAVHEKNMYWVNNQLLMLTSNAQLNVVNQALADPRALNRRIHLSIEPIPPPRGPDGRFPQRDGRVDFHQFRFVVNYPGVAQDPNNAFPRVPDVRGELTYAQLYSVIATKLAEFANLHNQAYGNDRPFAPHIDEPEDLPPPVVPVGFRPLGAQLDPLAQAIPQNGPTRIDIMILRYLTSGVSFGEDMKGILDWTAYQATFLDCNDSIRYFYLGSYDGDGSEADQKAYIKVHKVAGPRFDRTASSSLNDPPPAPEGRERDYMDSSFADYVNNLHSASAWHYVTLLKETLIKCGKMLSDAAKALFGYASDLFTKVTSPFQKAWASIGNMITRMTNCFKSCTEAQREFTKTYKTCALITAAFIGFGTLLYAYSYKAPTSSVNFYLQGGMKYNNDQGRTRRGQAMEGFTEEELHLKNGYKSRIRAFEAANSTSIDRSRRAAAADYARNAKIDGRYRSAPQASPDFRKLVERAAVFIHSPSGLVYRGIGVCDRMVVVPHHYYNYFADFKTFVVTTGGHSMELEINELNRVHIPESDLSAFFLPPQFPMFPNIIPRFIKKEDLTVLHTDVTMWITSPHGPTRELVMPPPTAPVNQVWAHPDVFDGYNFKALCYAFRQNTNNGDCGSLYTSGAAILGPRAILGMHTAFNGVTAFANVLTQDKLLMLWDAFDFGDDIVSDSLPGVPQGPTAMTPVTKKEIVVNGITLVNTDIRYTETYDLEREDRDETLQRLKESWDKTEHTPVPPDAIPIGMTPYGVHRPMKTKFVPSILSHNLPWTTNQAPAVLSRDASPTHEDPLVLAHRRRTPSGKLGDLDHQLLAESFRAVIQSLPKPPRRRVLTILESVEGFGAMNGLDHTASAGHIWNWKATQSGKPANKGTWIGTSYAPNIHPDLEEAVKEKLDILKAGKVPDWYATEALKDELLPTEKIAISKTRLYYCCPIDHVIIGRMLLGFFVAETMQNRSAKPGQISASIGIEPDDGTLKALADVSKDNDRATMDQKGWDNNQFWAIAEHEADAINEWYPKSETPEIKLARKTYLMSNYNMLYAVGNYIYMLSFGQVSGGFFTSPGNTFYLEGTFIAAFTQLLRRKFPNEPGSLIRWTPKIVKASIFGLYYGDDSIVVYPKSWKLSHQEIMNELRTFGLDPQHSVKSFPINQDLPHELHTFLSRSLMPNEDGVQSWFLPKSTIEEMILWTRKRDLQNLEVIQSTMRNMLVEARRHGKSYFQYILGALQKACTLNNIEWRLPTESHFYHTTGL